MLDRFPELQVLAGEPRVARALSSGDPHRVYRALWWGRLTGSFKALQELVDSLLANRRLFLKPVKRAPGLFTLNGIGVRIYGKAELDPADDTYIGTHFLTFVFLPVFPLRQYLCRSAGKQYQFFGTVPSGTVVFLWRLLVALTVAIGLAGAGISMLESARHNDLTVANGLDTPVELTLAGERVVVPANRVATRTLEVGAQEIVITTPKGKVLERATLELRRPPAVVVWNVLGAAGVFEERVPYTSGTTVTAPEPQVFCGQTLVVRDDVDFAFRELPKEVSVSSHGGVAWRTHLGVAPGGWRMCSSYLVQKGKIEAGIDLAASQADLDKASDVRLMFALLSSSRGDQAALDWIEAGLQEHDGVELHRCRQDAYSAAGRHAELAPIYRQRYQAHQDSADAAYLWARTLRRAEAIPLLADFRRRWPNHRYLLRSSAWNLHLDGRWEQSLPLWEELRAGDPDAVTFQAEALIGLGRVNDALALLQAQRLESMDDAVARGCAAHLAGKKLDLSRLAKLEMDPTMRTCMFHARVSGDVNKNLLGQVKEPGARAAVEITALLHSDGQSALARLKRAPAHTEEGLDSYSQLLLLGEALHANDQEIVRRIESALPRAGYFPSASRFVLGSGGAEELEELPLALRAVAQLAASRRPGVDVREARRLREAALRDDLFSTVVSHAIGTWSLR